MTELNSNLTRKRPINTKLPANQVLARYCDGKVRLERLASSPLVRGFRDGMFENPPGIKTSRKRRLLRRRGGVAEVTQVRRKAYVEQRLSWHESYPPETPVFRNVLRIYPSGMFQCEELCQAGAIPTATQKENSHEGRSPDWSSYSFGIGAVVLLFWTSQVS